MQKMSTILKKSTKPHKSNNRNAAICGIDEELSDIKRLIFSTNTNMPHEGTVGIIRLLSLTVDLFIAITNINF